jgi:hypothetical protein
MPRASAAETAGGDDNNALGRRWVSGLQSIINPRTAEKHFDEPRR